MEKVKITRGFREDIFKEIAIASGNKQTVADVSYERFIQVHSPTKIYAERIEKDAFLIGYTKKDGFRIVGMATRKEATGKGYATKLLRRCIRYCIENGITKIQTRTYSGKTFYEQKAGAKVIGMKDGDYLMEIGLPSRKKKDGNEDMVYIAIGQSGGAKPHS